MRDRLSPLKSRPLRNPGQGVDERLDVLAFDRGGIRADLAAVTRMNQYLIFQLVGSVLA